MKLGSWLDQRLSSSCTWKPSNKFLRNAKSYGILISAVYAVFVLGLQHEHCGEFAFFTLFFWTFHSWLVIAARVTWRPPHPSGAAMVEESNP